MTVSGDVALDRTAAPDAFSDAISPSATAASFGSHSAGMGMPSARLDSTSRSVRLRPRPGDTCDGDPPPTLVVTGSSAARTIRRISCIGDSGVNAATAARACG